MKKILYVVLDGLGDRPVEKLGGKTPTEAANTPYMDELSKSAKAGLLYTVGKGIAPESDIAVISILGYDAEKYYTGRGPIEAAAMKVKLNPGDVAHRCNFATHGEGMSIVDRRVGRDLGDEEAGKLADEINAKVQLTGVSGASFEFKHTVAHRAVLVIRKGGELSGWVTNSDPAYERHGLLGTVREEFAMVVDQVVAMEGHETDQKAIDSAKLANEFIEKSAAVLDASEVNKARVAAGKLAGNLILMRDAGDRLPTMPSIKEVFGVQLGCFAEMPVERGIAIATGMQIVEMPISGDNWAEIYPIWAKAVVPNLGKYDGLYVHIKGPDIPGHDGDGDKKLACIEAIDRHFFGTLLPELELDEVVMAVTADHATPAALKAHSDDPVPLMILGGGITGGEIETYCEKTCAKGSLGEMLGTQLLPKLLELAK
ncbi:MAG: phosphoglycerate mutase [Planctomycetes bacterium DG_58]|nr:MAG: phosphoglycerate mutase [Planctomycetes bacterium DG_58]KPL03207.1 MAG: phosphoglycerate mutase [Planctomycetes bacterium SM23_65]